MNNYDWPRIQIMYETGTTAYQLGKRPDFPSKQAIQDRANKHEWHKPETPNSLPILAEALNIDSRVMTDELLNVVLNMISEGATQEVSCMAAGISDRTWREWCVKDERLKDATQRARAGTIVGWMSSINRHSQGDWKAASWALTNMPDTREHFGTKGSDNRVEVTINIDRAVA